MYYGYVMATGKLSGASSDEVSGFFSNLMTSTGTMTGWMIVAVLLAFGVCSLGLQNGIERITKVMMICLLALIVVLAVHSVTLDGAMEGVKFYLVPNLDNIRAAGLGNVIFGALSQAFFTLSIGIGFLMMALGLLLLALTVWFTGKILPAILRKFTGFCSNLLNGRKAEKV